MSSILILGAGASIPFYNPRLSTEYLTTVISDQDRWNNIVERYTGIMGPDTDMVNTQTVLEVLNEISIVHPNYHFEQIIEIYDKICSFNFNPQPNSKILHDILLYYGATSPNLGDHVWSCVPFLFRQIITEEVARLHLNHKVETYNQLTESQTNFVSSISEDQSINIFTLNYDEIILDAIQNLNFTTGFDDNGRFNVNAFLLAKKTISFPHGHSRLTFDSNGILYHTNSQLANECRLDRIGAYDGQQTKYLTENAYSYSFNTFISTGQQKEPTFDVNPYSTYYQKFASDCLKANKIYVVGYSFSDPHFNRMLMNFLVISPTNKIIIVDYLPDQIQIVNEFTNGRSLIYKIFNLLGINSIAMDTNLQEREQNLNENGFAEIYTQIVLYKKGYDNFLNEFNEIDI
ncbi:SIR2 family protein [Cellulophaga sp. BC115SP]|uniref:SIR2 family protein n=1 Tax=Cellulophaga sp. BC115SP TaxID=2683263 RepID=UPI0014121784|nr:SIR2 family protein [Cellulophaga sp. BC115SP]NBB31805.1 hypothetical protein [Cellulophaga sp. BC115SP]